MEHTYEIKYLSNEYKVIYVKIKAKDKGTARDLCKNSYSDVQAILSINYLN